VVVRGDHFVYVGRVVTVYGGTKIRGLLLRLKSVATSKSPFGAPRKRAGVTWTKPKLVAEIEFVGWTGDGMGRQAAFKEVVVGGWSTGLADQRAISVGAAILPSGWDGAPITRLIQRGPTLSPLRPPPVREALVPSEAFFFGNERRYVALATKETPVEAIGGHSPTNQTP
jgi:ATP dependent DNA ligase C terminal region